MNIIKFEEFQKLEIVVAKIIKIEQIQGADKLYKLTLNAGAKKKIVLAGIKEFYKPKDLKNKLVIYLSNLEPKIIRGIKSEGMILAADYQNKAILIMPHKSVKPGTKIR